MSQAILIIAICIFGALLQRLNAADVVFARTDLDIRLAKTVTPNFASFSIEVGSAPGWIGLYPAPAKQSYVNLMHQLTVTPNTAGPIMRVGGNSADTSWYNPEGKPKPPGITYDITDADIRSYAAAAKATNSTYILGLNFRQANTSEWAVAHITAVAKLIGESSVAAVEIGNECDLYKGNGIRTPEYTYDDYQREWLHYASDLRKAVPTWREGFIQGATWCCGTWTVYLTTYLQNAINLHSLSLHSYANSHCSGHNVTMTDILSDHASQYYAGYLQQNRIVENVNSHRIPFLVGEGNSVSCGGMPHISNSFGSALWSIDVLLNLAAVGVSHFNFHGGGSSTESYSAIVYRNNSDQIPIVQPLYYGLRFFSEATRDHFQIVNTTILNTTNPFIKVHSGYTSNGVIHFVIIHKDLEATTPATVTVIIPGNTRSYPAAAVFPLTAPSAASEFGLDFAGISYDGTKDGFPSGSIRPEMVPPRSAHEGVYSITVRPLSAAIVRVALDSEVTTQ